MAVHGNKPEDYLKPGHTMNEVQEPPKAGQKVTLPKKKGQQVRTGDGIHISGDLTIIHRDKDGNVKGKETYQNVITYDGLQQASLLIAGLATNFFKHIYIGTGAHDPANPGQILPPDPSDTALKTFYASGLAVITPVTVTNNPDRGFQAIARFAYTFNFTEEVHVNEAGIFTDDHTVADAIMLSYKTFYDRVVFNLDFLELVWEISFTRYPKDKIT